MIEKECAKEIYQLSLKAIEALSEIVVISQNKCPDEDYDRLRKMVGLSIGGIQTNLLDNICLEYPELDDLKK